MATPNTDPAVELAANDCLHTMSYTDGKLQLDIDNFRLTEGAGEVVDAPNQELASPVEPVDSTPQSWPYPPFPQCSNPIHNNCDGELFLDRSAVVDGVWTHEEDILLDTETRSRVLGAKQLTYQTKFTPGSDCYREKQAYFYGSVDFHTRIRAPFSEAPLDADGNPVVETTEQQNRRLGLPGFHVGSAVYIRDSRYLRGYSFQADDGGHFKSDNSSFRSRTVQQNIPIVGYVELNEAIVMDLHVAPSTWFRTTGSIVVSSKIRVNLIVFHVSTLQP